MTQSKYACRRTQPRGQGYGVDLSASVDNKDALKEWADLSTELAQLFASESARGMALISRAFTESLLEACLRKAQRDRIRRKPNYSDILEGGLAKKIRVCLEDRVVPRRLKTKLCCIKEIGDAFAHNHRITSFTDPIVLPYMRRLHRSTIALGGRFRETHGKTDLIFAMQLIIANATDLNPRRRGTSKA